MYQYICSKYTRLPALGVFVLGAYLGLSSIFGSAKTGDAGIGVLLGLTLAIVLEKEIVAELSHRNIESNRGSKIYRGVQAGFVAAGIILGGSVDLFRYEGSRPHPPQQHTRTLNTKPLQAQLNS